MNSKLIDAPKLKMQSVAIVLTDNKPADGLHFKERSRGGTGLGFGDRYGGFPIDCLLSTGNKEMAAKMNRAGSSMVEGERFFKNPELAGKWVESLPFADVPTEYVLFMPWEQVTEQVEPELIVFFVNADQLSAL